MPARHTTPPLSLVADVSVVAFPSLRGLGLPEARRWSSARRLLALYRASICLRRIIRALIRGSIRRLCEPVRCATRRPAALWERLDLLLRLWPETR